MAGIGDTIADMFFGPKTEEFCSKCSFKYPKSQMIEHKDQGWMCKKCTTKMVVGDSE